MPSLNDVVAEHTDLAADDLEWLHALVADWQLLSDLSFADLVLYVPDRDGAGFHVAAQMRPTTGPTAYEGDLVATASPRGRRPLVDQAFDDGRICREGDPEWPDDVPVRVETIPVRRAGRVVAVVARSTNLVAVRMPSRLELTYLDCAALLSRMVAEGRFPQRGTDLGRRGAPRVGDGMVHLDAAGVVLFASPNAISAYRRLGLAADLVGRRLGDVTAALAPQAGRTDEALSTVVAGRAQRRTEVEGNGMVMTLRAIPLDPGGAHVGAVVLVRDVTELRRRERELLTREATIREIHHRVKNNLQTVASLLRLQARRVPPGDARDVLDEAVRRVATIALVHETLSATVDDTVQFDVVADRLLATTTELSLAGERVRTQREGSFGVLAADVATPLAMALNEVLHNAAEHGVGEGGGRVRLAVARSVTGSGAGLVLTVADDGPGLPADVDGARGGGLGLQIVRALVGELGGRLELGSSAGTGTVVTIDVPLPGAPTPRSPDGERGVEA